MFIAPQHFQQSDLAHRTYVNEVACLDLQGTDFGLSDLQTNDEHLQMGKVFVERAAGIFPDRTFFRLAAELSIDIPDGTVDTIVHLALPLERSGVTQVGETQGVHRLLRGRSTLTDLADAENEPLEADVAELGVSLMLEGADLSGFSVIPIVRVLEKNPDGRVVLDRGFVPPCVAVAGCKALRDRLDEIVSLMRARASNAAARISSARVTQSTAALLDERFELQLLNTALARLQNAAAHPQISGRRLYEYLAEILAGIVAAQALPIEPELVFDPKNPSAAFANVLAELRKHLTLQSQVSVVALGWNTELFEKRRLLRMIVPQKLLSEGRRPVLAISGPESADELSKIAPLACKLAGISAMPELVQRGLSGVSLRAMGTAPPELRERSDSAFFAVDTGSQHWQRFLDKREALALHVDDRIQHLEATLYMLG